MRIIADKYAPHNTRGHAHSQSGRGKPPRPSAPHPEHCANRDIEEPLEQPVSRGGENGEVSLNGKGDRRRDAVP